MGTTQLVKKYDYIIHVINLEDIGAVIQQFHHNLDIIGDLPHRDMARAQLLEMEDALHTLLPRRKTRGLVNVGGALMKFVFGTMDEEDRQNVEEQQRVMAENNHQLIEGFNQQIVINNNFNKSIQTLRSVLVADRGEITNSINKMKDANENLIKENLATLQLLKINILKRKMENLQQTVASARLGIFSPTLLTKEEIETFKIDVEKLKQIKIGLVTSQNMAISLIIKVPLERITLKKSVIIPVPNGENLQIDEGMEYIVRLGDKAFSYVEGRTFFELTESRSCVIRQPCRMVKKTQQDIIQLDDSIVVVINANSTNLKSTCDSRGLRLQNHYYIHFNNCTLKLGDSTFTNRWTKLEQSFAIPPREFSFSTERPIVFEDIVLTQEENIKKIHELYVHRVVTTTIGVTTFALLVGVAITVIILFRRQRRVSVRITENRITKGTVRNSQIRRNFAKDQSVDEV